MKTLKFPVEKPDSLKECIEYFGQYNDSFKVFSSAISYCKKLFKEQDKEELKGTGFSIIKKKSKRKCFDSKGFKEQFGEAVYNQFMKDVDVEEWIVIRK
jgi:adenylyl- and sulfurtransferase ThiI